VPEIIQQEQFSAFIFFKKNQHIGIE